MIVVDASVIVAILGEEDDGQEFAAKLTTLISERRSLFVSTVSIWEGAVALARLWRIDRVIAMVEVTAFLTASAIKPVAPDMTITTLAVEAAQHYGMGAGYPGILNLGDCFSYATARHLGAALLFKGDDFGRTDIRAA